MLATTLPVSLTERTIPEDDMMRSDERTTDGRVVVRGLEYEVPYGRAQKPATTQIHPIEDKKIDKMAQ